MTTATVERAIENLHIGEVTYQPFATYYHYVECKGRCTTEQAIEYMCEELGLDYGDTSIHMEAIKYLIGYYITNYYNLVEDEDALWSEEDIKVDFRMFLQVREAACFEAADNGGGDHFWYACRKREEEVA